MLNIGSLMIESLDYIFIVDKKYNIIYNSRYDRHFSGKSGEYAPGDMLSKSFFEAYPGLNRDNSNVIRSMQTQSVIVNKQQAYQDYLGRRYFTNNVTIPLRRKGELVAVVELAVDVQSRDGGEEDRDGDRKFDEFIFHLKKEADMITFDTILTKNEQMKACIEKAKFLSRLPNPTLLCGETGTGKELFAQAMITYSGAPREKVVIQNCATVPENLMESILFGTVKGAYTGAEDKAGLFAQADGGILFLDELNSIPYQVQSKLLRVLQDGTFRPLGSSRDERACVKVIGAMNVDPVEAMEKKIIRSDLFYRFSGGLIDLPPLRERREDIDFYAGYYIDYFNQVYDKAVEGIDDEVRVLFLNYSWEGNVRELKNTVESMIASAQDQRLLTRERIPEYMRRRLEQEPGKRRSVEIEVDVLGGIGESEIIPYYDIMEGTEKILIEKALAMAGGNKSRASEILGLPRQTLKYRIKKLKL